MKTPKINGVNLGYAISLFFLMFYGLSLCLSGRFSYIDMRSMDLIRDGGASIYLFLSGMVVSISQLSANTSKSKLKAFLIKKGSLIFLMGVLLSPSWPMNLFVVLGISYVAAQFLIGWRKNWVGAVTISAGLASIALYSVIFPHMLMEPAELSLDVAMDGFILQMATFLVFKGYFSILPWIVIFLSGFYFGMYGDVRTREQKKVMTTGVSLVFTGLVIHLFTRSIFPVNSLLENEFYGMLIGFVSINQLAFFFFAPGISILMYQFCSKISSVSKGKWIYRIKSLGRMQLSAYLFYLVLGTSIHMLFDETNFESLTNKIIVFVLVFWLIFRISNYWRRKINKEGPLEWLFLNLTK